MKRIKLILLTVATVMAVAALTAVSKARESQNSPAPLDKSSSSVRKNAATAIWLTDFGTARQKAKAEHKSILLDFTGSDWCGWCMKLDREVFSTSEFRDFADKHLVLVKVDFPMNKAQTDAEKVQNQQLAARFQIEGYPTLVVLAPDDSQLGALGYMPGGPKPLIDKITETIAGH